MKNIETKYEKNDFVIINFITGFSLLYACNQIIAFSFAGTTLNNIWNILYKLILLVLLCRAMIPIVKKIGFLFFIIEVCFLIVYLISLIGYGNVEFELWKNVTFNFLVVYVPLGTGAYCIENKELFFNQLYKMAWPTQFVLLISLVTVGSSAEETYSMSSGYALLVQMMIICGHWIISKRKIDAIFVVLDFIVILLFGSRGPILCFIMFVIFNLVFSNKISIKQKLLYIVCITFIIVMGVIFYQDILRILADIMDKFGFSSRTLRLMEQGIVTYNSGRDILYDGYFSLIKEKPLLGWGAIGGRKYGVYPHNFYVELILCFGIPMGSVLILLITKILVKGLLQNETYAQLLAYIYVSKVVGLFLSSSIFQSSDFLICIALCMTGRLYVKIGGKNIGHMVYYRHIDNTGISTRKF